MCSLDTQFESYLDHLSNNIKDSSDLFNNFSPFEGSEKYFMTLGGEEPGIPDQTPVQLPSGDVIVSTAVNTTQLDAINHHNSNIASQIKQCMDSKNKLIVFAAKNNILLQVKYGMLEAICPGKVDNAFFIKRALLETQLEHLINAQVKAELFERAQACKLESIQECKLFFKYIVEEFPVLDRAYFEDIYKESHQQLGERFVHDLMNRPEGFDPVTDRTPSPELAQSSDVASSSKRHADTTLEQGTKIQKTILNQVPRNIFKEH